MTEGIEHRHSEGEEPTTADILGGVLDMARDTARAELGREPTDEEVIRFAHEYLMQPIDPEDD